MRAHDLTNLCLLRFHGQRGIDDGKSEFGDHLFVFFNDASLEHSEAVFRIIAQSQIQSGLVILEPAASAYEPPDGCLQWNAKVERGRRLHRESIKFAYPLAVHSAGNV